MVHHDKNIALRSVTMRYAGADGGTRPTGKTLKCEKCWREAWRRLGERASCERCTAKVHWSLASPKGALLGGVIQTLWEAESRNHLQNDCLTFCCCVVGIHKARKASIS